MTVRYHVYHLVDPVTHQVRYIGKSTQPKSRLKQHIAESIIRQNTHKKQWIAGLIAAGQTPALVVVESYLTETAARTRESEECHRHRGTILNIHDPAKGARDLHKQKGAVK